MELRQLTYFIAISDARSFTRAAEKLYVSQPALTGQINSLENELGMKLFDRTNKSVQLTPAGEVFYRHATQVLSEVENTLNHVHTIRQSEQSSICFSVHPIFSGPTFQTIYRTVCEQFPERQLLFDIADFSGMESSQLRRRYRFRILPSFAVQSSEGRMLAESPFLFAAMDRNAFFSSNKQYLLPGYTRLSNNLTEFLPDDAPISMINTLDHVDEYMRPSNAVAFLPRVLVPRDATCQEIPNPPRLGMLFVTSDRCMEESLTNVLRQALANLGWE